MDRLILSFQSEYRSSNSMTALWIRIVGSSKWQVSFAKEPYKRDYILQRRRLMLWSHSEYGSSNCIISIWIQMVQFYCLTLNTDRLILSSHSEYGSSNFVVSLWIRIVKFYHLTLNTDRLIISSRDKVYHKSSVSMYHIVSYHLR